MVTPLFAHFLNAQLFPDTTGVYIAPFFVFGGGYRSTLNLVNPTNANVSVEIVARDGSGRILGEVVQHTLGPGEGLRSDVQTLFEIAVIATFPPPLVDGYIRIRDARNQGVSLVGNVEVASIGQGTFTQSAMSYPVGPPSVGPWVVPLAFGGSRFYSGLAIANPSELLNAGADVTIEIIHADGTVMHVEEVSLPPRGLHTQVLPETLRSGYVRITSDMPIRIVGVLGTRDSRLLEQVNAVER